MSDSLSSRHWRNYRASLIATLPPICSICGQPVDKTLPGNHPDGPTIDHRIPRSHGGATYQRNNCALAHWHCNSAKANHYTTTTSRNW